MVFGRVAFDMNCSDAAEFIAHAPLRYILGVQIVLCALSIAVSVLFIKHCRNDLYFHKNCRLLLWTMLVINIAHSVFVLVLQSTHLGKIYTSVTPCDVLVPAAFCYSFRMPATVCFAAHATIHLSMVIERAVATKLIRTYEKSSEWIGFLLTGLSIIFALGIALFSMMNYSFSDTTFYCSAATKTTMNQVSGTCYFIVTMEAFSVVIFGGVYFWNRIRERSKLYDLRSKYQTRENLVVLRLLLPVVLLHFIMFSCFCLANGISTHIRFLFDSDSSFRAYLAAAYIIPFYTVLAPLLLWWILKKHRRRRSEHLCNISVKPRNEDEVYFSSYAAVWNIK